MWYEHGRKLPTDSTPRTYALLYDLQQQIMAVTCQAIWLICQLRFPSKKSLLMS